MQEEEREFNLEKKESESWNEYFTRIDAHMKERGLTIEQEKELGRLTDRIVEEIYKNELEGMAKKVKAN